jgi:BirA family transcriptional regulator, biotin operon repressor / biotin---[acetyl-CoA-carboxylase] ligase
MYKIPGKTHFLGKKIISLPSCESTNSLMVAMTESCLLEEGAVIITEHQTNGRGQARNQWTSEPGANLTFSVLLNPTFIEPSQQFFLNMAVGLSVCDCVSEILGWHAHVKLKWPNDILVGGKKICGILIENQIQGKLLSHSIVGIGLNVNQKKFEWPEASSLSLYSSFDYDKENILRILFQKLEGRYAQLKGKSLEKLKDDYMAVLYWHGEDHEFQSQGKVFMGRIEGVDEVGRLQVMVNGGLVKYNFREIKFLR